MTWARRLAPNNAASCKQAATSYRMQKGPINGRGRDLASYLARPFLRLSCFTSLSSHLIMYGPARPKADWGGGGGGDAMAV